ncbi:iron uptake system protein EfeO [Cellulomonas alba]|uniref:Iron uptake system protein EfeO n=1 Tax=Cellulomonas alba TaxID=3053467 RepID=A0ABT7SHP9_9CELL|nr:iron uptake system protein EfeO [Cellulomonas alba]MDM7855716.1 iron uptake system protein EfeO [Cellulomonas alba]
MQNPTSSRPRTAAAAATVAALAALALAACSSGGGEPAAQPSGSATSGGAAKVAVTLTSAGGADACEVDTTSVPAGPVTFTVTNKDSAVISEIELLAGQRIVGEKENLAPGLAPVSFTVTLDGGSYAVYCPGAATDTVPFTVTGQAATPTGGASAILEAGTTTYATYVAGVVASMVTSVDALKAAVDAGDLPAAQKAYAAARPFYERIESDVAGFVLPGADPTDNSGNLDYLVDMRASNLDDAVGWHGFHAVEKDLFEAKTITAGTKTLAAELDANVRKLAELSRSLTYRPEDLANGAAGLLEEVQANKIKGEEERYSHIDLVDFAANVEGAEQAFANLEPGLEQIDPDLTATVEQRFDDVRALLKTYEDPTALGGYRPYTAALKASDSAKLSQAIQALQEPLSSIAEKVATAR